MGDHIAYSEVSYVCLDIHCVFEPGDIKKIKENLRIIIQHTESIIRDHCVLDVAIAVGISVRCEAQ